MHFHSSLAERAPLDGSPSPRFCPQKMHPHCHVHLCRSSPGADPLPRLFTQRGMTPPTSSEVGSTQVSGHGPHHDSRGWSNAAPSGPTLGPLQHTVLFCQLPGDPAPIGPPAGRPVEMSGWPGKGRNLRQNRGGKYQGQRRGHSAAQTSRATMEARTTPASTTNEHVPPAEMRATPAETMKVHAMPTCTTRRDGVFGPHAHGNAARHVVGDLDAEGSRQ